MEILSFLDPSTGKRIYAIGPFREKAHASRASAALANASSPASNRPRGPITSKCWAIFDLLSAQAPSLSRSQLIDECERQGIKRSTAATQLSLYRRAQANSLATLNEAIRAAKAAPKAR